MIFACIDILTMDRVFPHLSALLEWIRALSRSMTQMYRTEDSHRSMPILAVCWDRYRPTVYPQHRRGRRQNNSNKINIVGIKHTTQLPWVICMAAIHHVSIHAGLDEPVWVILAQRDLYTQCIAHTQNTKRPAKS